MSSSNGRPSSSAPQREDPPQSTTNTCAVTHFYNYVGGKRIAGINGYGEPDDYISIRDLEEYWLEDRVRNILHSITPPINVNIDDIIKRYLRTFSILLYINRVSYIRYFRQHDYDDERLPYNDAIPFDLPKTEETRQVWDNILKNQWIFSPFQFGPKMPHLRPLDPQVILPITVVEKLTPDTKDEEAAVVHVVELHKDYNRLLRVSDNGFAFPLFGVLTCILAGYQSQDRLQEICLAAVEGTLGERGRDIHGNKRPGPLRPDR